MCILAPFADSWGQWLCDALFRWLFLQIYLYSQSLDPPSLIQTAAHQSCLVSKRPSQNTITLHQTGVLSSLSSSWALRVMHWWPHNLAGFYKMQKMAIMILNCQKRLSIEIILMKSQLKAKCLPCEMHGMTSEAFCLDQLHAEIPRKNSTCFMRWLMCLQAYIDSGASTVHFGHWNLHPKQLRWL